jgi:hypothetical protein
VTDDKFVGIDMIGKLSGGEQRLAYQTTNPLPQSVVETPNMIDLARQLAGSSVQCGGTYAFIHHILITVKRGVLTVRQRHFRPQSLGTLGAANIHVKGNHLVCLGVHGEPNPLLIRLLLDKVAHFVGFHLKALNPHVLGTGDRLDVKMIRQSLPYW